MGDRLMGTNQEDSFFPITHNLLPITPPLLFTLLVTGLSGIVVQTVLIRESLVIYGGNELSIGVIIGSWVVWEALGAYIGGRWPRGERAVGHVLIGAGILFAVLFPAGIYCVRILKIVSGLPPEVSMGIAGIFCTSMIVFFPSGLLHGLSFTTAYRIYDRLKGPDSMAASRVYFFEMLGTIVGGVLVSYVLITRLNSFDIAGVVVVLMSLACLALALSSPAGPARLLAAVSLSVAVCSSLLMALGVGEYFHWRSIGAQWHGREVVHYHNSHYQNITVTREQDQYTFFTDGLPAATIPVPDIVRVEEIVHIPFLAHGAPRDVLVLHGGAGGVIGEALKYPTVEHIDYVEVDPAYLAAIIRYPSELVLSELGDKRLALHYTDGRRFVNRTTRRYDVVLSGLSAPRTLQANRFFTVEFFREVKKILKKDGIFVFTVPGSLAYYDRELRDVNMSALLSARSVFPSVAVVPGEDNLFLAGVSGDPIALSAQGMETRLRQYGIAARLISLPHLSYRLDRDRVNWYFSATKPSRAKKDRDLTPTGVYYNVAFANALHTPWMKGFFAAAQEKGTAVFLLVAAIIVAAAFLLKGRYPATPVLFVISTTGFVVMLLELSLIFVFQVLYGNVFREIGMLITMLMAGMAAGSMAVGRLGAKTRDTSKSLAAIEGALALFCIFLVIVFSLSGRIATAGETLLRIVFFALLFVSGLFAGMEFPLAVRLYENGRPREGSVGPVYGSDLAGGFAGGLAGGFFLFPLMGVTGSCLVFAALKMCGFLLLLSRKRK
ncbi:MAG TPA: hypothetical protein DDZ40_04640 [Deltaproteobacteria bacterium]|nr:hypothetical protein [Deltaproteobacteria bacterium]